MQTNDIRRVAGVLAIVLGVGVCFAVLSSTHFRNGNGRDITAALWFAIPAIGLGMGAFLGVKIAGFFLLAIYSAGGTIFAVTSLLYVPFPWSLINCIFGGLFLVPSFVLLFRWQRGKKNE